MINLLNIVSVPILAFNLGFVNPHIDLNHNIRETYRTQVIQQRQGTDEKRLASEIANSKRFKEWSNKQKENKKSKSDKLEDSRTRRGARNFRNRDFTNNCVKGLMRDMVIKGELHSFMFILGLSLVSV